MKYKMSLVFKCYLKKQPTPPFPSKEIVMNSIFISSKSHPNLKGDNIFADSDKL